MADRCVFADEAGNFDFSRRLGASRYFILCTITSTHCEIGDALLSLRRDLGWRGLHLDRVFHATEDPQPVRDEVFALLAGMNCSVDFKKLVWNMSSSDRLFVAASSLGTKKARHALHAAVDEVVLQLSPCNSHRVAFWPADSDPCLQVADYCTWAIQRKWERNDERSHALIAPKIHSEFDVWQRGTEHYY